MNAVPQDERQPADASPPKVSVIVPCYNLGEYLAEAVESVLVQTYQDFEILIVDDGSTDPETQRILDDFKRPKTTVFRTRNSRLPAARNFLIARARGEYLCALDADDKLHPQYLEKTVAVLEREPSTTFVGAHLQMFGAENRVWPADPRCDLPMLLAEDTVITPALVRRAAVTAVGGYDENMPHQGNEDWDLWITLLERGYRGVVLPEVLFFYRRRPGSMCDECTRGQVHLDLIEYMVRKHTDSYRAHLQEVLLWKEGHISDLRRQNVQLEIDIGSHLVPELARRREELKALKRKRADARRLNRQPEDRSSDPNAELDRQRAETAVLRSQYQRAVADLDALRSSASWRVTGPLRSMYSALRRILGGDAA